MYICVTRTRWVKLFPLNGNWKISFIQMYIKSLVVTDGPVLSVSKTSWQLYVFSGALNVRYGSIRINRDQIKPCANICIWSMKHEELTSLSRDISGIDFAATVWSGYNAVNSFTTPLITRFMGPAWGPSGADRTQVGPMLAPWTLLSGTFIEDNPWWLTHEAMMTSWYGNVFRVTGPLWWELSHNEPVVWSFHSFFDVSQEKN